MTNVQNNIINAYVWPGDVHFPDFHQPNTTKWWKNNFHALNSEVKFDGIWLDMNEVSNFCEGECSKIFFFKQDLSTILIRLENNLQWKI